MKENLTRAPRAGRSDLRRLHRRPEGRRDPRHRRAAPRRLHGLPLGGHAQLRAALQQPRLRATPPRSSTSSTPQGVAVQAEQRRQHDHGAARRRSTRPGSASAARACRPRSDGGYSLLDDQSLSTSQFQEQTDFKRAMEGELANTIEAIDGVDAAVVHLAMPQKQVFADEQDPTTASVLVKTARRHDARPEQVQAVVNLVASSIDGLDAGQGHRRRLHRQGALRPGGASAARLAQPQTQQVEDFQNRIDRRCRRMLDRVLGPGNSAVQVTANLYFDKTVSETTTLLRQRRHAPLSEHRDERDPTRRRRRRHGGAVSSAPTARWTPHDHRRRRLVVREESAHLGQRRRQRGRAPRGRPRRRGVPARRRRPRHPRAPRQSTRPTSRT